MLLVGEGDHIRGKVRCASPPARAGGLVVRVVNLLWPWGLRQYPGKRAMLAHVCGAKTATAKFWLHERDPLPAHAARKLESHLRTQAALALELADELRRHAQSREQAAVRPRGFAMVRVREPGGFPRDARWRGRSLKPF